MSERWATHRRLSKTARDRGARFLELLRLVGLRVSDAKVPQQFSGGQR